MKHSLVAIAFGLLLGPPPAADLKLTKTVTPLSLPAGSDLTYKIVVKNRSSSKAQSIEVSADVSRPRLSDM